MSTTFAERPRSPSQTVEGAESSRPARKALDAGFAATVLAAVLVGTAWFVHHYAINALYYDQWNDVNVVGHLRSGSLTFGTLWAQHNENRVLFPNLVVLLLGQTVDFNVVVESAISAVLWWTTAALLVLAHRRRVPGLAWLLYGPIVLLFASTVALFDTLFGFNLSWFMVLASLAAALFLLDRPQMTRWALATAIAVAVVGSYSSAQGLLIWPAGLAVLWLRGRRGAWAAAWIGSAVVTLALFFIGFSYSQVNRTYGTGGPRGAAAMIRFFFTSLGNIFGTQFPTVDSENNAVLVVGLVVFAIAVAAVVYGIRNPADGSAIGVALVTFGLCVVAVTTVGRTSLGLIAESRYDIFIMTVWVGSYIVFLRPAVLHEIERPLSWWGRVRRWVKAALMPHSVDRESPPRVRRGHWIAPVAFCLLLIMVIFQFVFGWSPGLNDAQGWRTAQLDRADVAANVNQASDYLVNELRPNMPSFARRMIGVAKRDRLSLFATSLANEDAHRGLFPWLVAQVVRPIPGQVLSGTATLDAAVGDVHGLVRAQFVVQGSESRETPVGLAKATGYGWIYRWPTTTIADGVYRVSVVLDYRGGRRIASTPVTAVVRNQVAAAGVSRSTPTSK
jgi:hypothetical protein